MKTYLRNILKIFCVFCIILIFIHKFCSASNEFKNLEDDKKKTKNKITATNEKINKISEEKDKTLDQVEKLIVQISEYNEEIDELNGKINTLQIKIKEAQKQIEQDEFEYKKEQKSLDKRLVAIYKSGETSYLDFLLSSTSIVDFLSGYYLISEVVDYDTKMLESLEKHRQKIQKEKDELEDNKKNLNNSKTALASKNQELKVIKKTKENYVRELSDDEKKLEQQLSELTLYEQNINKRIVALQKQYDKKKIKNNSSSLKSELSDSFAKTELNYRFGYPVKNHNIGTKYGVSGKYWSSGHHTGVDFPVPTGTPVYSVEDGQVVDCGKNKAYGYFVEVYHGNNIYSFYAHASNYIVSIGQHVSKGQQIMYSGATGNVTAAHLHFEIRTPGPRYANCVNPMHYLE